MEKDYIYEVSRLAEPIKIDADWNKAQWKKIIAAKLTNNMGQDPGFRPEVKVKMMYDKENLYIIFSVHDKFVRCITNEINGPVWEDSCVEFFFAPDAANPERYFNLEINCGGTPLMHYNMIAKEKITVLDADLIRKIEIAHTLPGIVDPELPGLVEWTNEYRIPLDILRKYSQISNPGPGVAWKGNFYKIAENNSNPHYITWAVVKNTVPDFHLPQYFGQLRFI
jgi:hypothetical protein